MSIDGRRGGPGEWMSVHEAASLMGVSPATLRRWSDAGDIRTFTTPGGHRRFSRSAIAGLLPDEATQGPTPDQLDGTRARLLRAIHRGSRRIAHGASWTESLAEDDRIAFAIDGRHMIDGVLGIVDDGDGDPSAGALRARSAAMRSGALAARRGLSLRETVETCLLLRSMVIRELAAAARRLDLDGPATSHWLEAATREIDVLVSEVMRGHELDGKGAPEHDSRPTECGVHSIGLLTP